MKRRALTLVAALGAAAIGADCRQTPASVRAGEAARQAPKGDVIWLMDPAGPGEPVLEQQLERLGAAALFLPAGRVDLDSGRWMLRLDAPPAHRFGRTPVVLVLRAGEALADAFTGSNAPDADAIAASVGPVLAETAHAGAYGRVIGVHLDFAFGPAGAGHYAQLVGGLRKSVPGSFLSISVRALPRTDDERKQVEPLFASADALVAFAFGAGPRVDPVAMDAARRPWWAAYDTRAPGVLVGPNGEARGDVPERFLDALSGNPRVEFENDLSVNDASVAAFTLTMRGPVRLDGVSLTTGDRISFRLPAINEMLFQLGSNLAGKRFALGRAILFGGASEAERVFSLAAFEDVLLGRSLAPVMEGMTRPAGLNAVTVELINRSHQATIVSRVANWIEVDLSPARPADVQPGGFDRYEVYDAGERPVSPGRATRVRLFETLIAPMEAVTPARIVVRGSLPAGCCRFRLHASAASGPEITMDWSAPPPTPTPAPRKAASRKAK
jgi:hypothetical protein